MRTPVQRASTAALAVLVTGALAPPAGAQLEEVIVTAQKREQSVQDIGLTVTAFDERSYRELAGGDLDRFAGQITSVQAYAPHSFLQSVHIRGIGLNEFQGQYDSPVAQHIDEVYIAKPWMIARPMYDLRRVEVLKGPQGTLFGRNTTGGALNWYTNEPTERFEAYAEASFDEHERASVQGAVSGPIAGALLGRLSFYTAFGSGGPQKNLFTGEEHGKPNLFDFRGQVLWERDNLSMRALVHGGIDKSEKIAWKGPGIFNLGAPGFCAPVLAGSVSDNPSACPKFAGLATAIGRPEGEFEPEATHTIDQDAPPAVDDTFYGAYLRLDYDMGWGTLTSITAYQYYERNHREDSDSSIFRSTNTHYYNEIDTISQELRLTGQFTDRWRYVAGLYYENDDLEQVDGSDLSANPLGVAPPFAPHFFADLTNEVESIALFFHNEYDFTDTVTANVGVRYTQDSTKASGILGLGLNDPDGDEDRVTPCLVTTFSPVGAFAPACAFLGALGLPPAPNGGVFSDNRTDTNVSWRFGVEWKPVDNWLVYGNLTTGYRSGGYSLPFAGTATQFEPETLFVQEIGFKSQLLDDTLQVNATAFKYDYDDVQVNVDDPISPLVPITRNVGKQKNKGLELEAIWRPTERWYLKQGIGYLDARYEKVNIDPATGLPRAITSYSGAIPLEGKRPVNSPEWTYNGVVRYQQPLFAGWDVIVMSDYRWIDDRFLEATNQVFDLAEAYWLVNARAALASQDGRWEIALWAKNVFDEDYLTYINNISFFKLDVFGEQRTVGMNLRYSFE